MADKKMFDSPLVVPKSVGLTKAVADLAEQMAELHRSKSLSDYVRGLILLDAFIVNGKVPNIRPSDLPHWLMSEYSFDFLRKMNAEYGSQSKVKGKQGLSLDDLAKL